MIRISPRARAGITLTEILISLLIMAVGMISLATLFPVSLMRVRDATRNSRSTILAQSAYGEFSSRKLLDKRSFLMSWYGNNALYLNGAFPPYDPFTVDPNFINTAVPGLQPVIGPGLPVCYDPLWRANAQPSPTLGFLPNMGVYPHMAMEARFGFGVGLLPNDPVDGAPPSAWGLQRITNFMPGSVAPLFWPYTFPTPLAPYSPDVAGSVFASNDDIVMQTAGNKATNALAVNGVGATIVPDLSGGGVISDWKYSWFFTGKQIDVNDPNASVFVGDIVVCESRQFNYELAYGIPMALGETPVQAIFGYSTNIAYDGFPVGGDNLILLRWPTGMPDPDVRVGGWVADVTYDRIGATSQSRYNTAIVPNQTTFYPGQRCHWYRVVKRSSSAAEIPGVTSQPAQQGYRRMTVFIDGKVRAKTQNIGGAFHINTALVMPSVVNVFPKVIYSR